MADDIYVAAPDGSYLKFPAGTSEDVMTGAMRSAYPPPATDAAPIMGDEYGRSAADIDAGAKAVPGALNAAADAATFGVGDRAFAAGRALKGDVGYDQALAEKRAQTQQFAKENPATDAVMRLVGGGASMAGPMKAGVSFLPYALQKGTPLAMRAGLMGAEGAVYAGANAAGHDEKVLPAMEGGMAVGAGLPLLGAGAGAMFRLGSSMFGPTVDGIQNAGTGRILNTIVNPKTEETLQKFGPEASIYDTSPQATAVAQGLGPQRNQMQPWFDARQEGAGARIGADVDQQFGRAQSPGQLREAIDGSGQQVIGPALQRAEAAPPISGPAMDELAQRPAIQQGLREAGTNAANEGRPLPMVTTDEAGRVLPNDAAEQFRLGSTQRIDRALAETLGNGRPLEQADQIIAQRAADAERMYPGALDQPIDYTSPHGQGLLDVLQRVPAAARAKANDLLTMRGRGANQFTFGTTPNEEGLFPLDVAPNPRQWDLIRQAIRDTQGEAVRSGNGNMAGATGQLINDIDTHLTPAVPGLAEARQVFAGHSRLNDALQAGKGIWSPNVTREHVERVFNSLGTEGEREMFRMGAGAAMREKVANVDPTSQSLNLPHTVWNKPAVQDKLAAITPPDRLNAFAQAMQNEGQAFNSAVQPNNRAWKQAYDVVSEGAKKEGPQGQAIDVARQDLRRQLDQNPDLRLALGRQDFDQGLRGAVGRGQGAIRDPKANPQDIASAFRAAPPEQQYAEALGARSEIGDKLGAAPNKVSMLAKMLRSDSGKAKSDLYFGEDATGNVKDALSREAAFSNTNQRVFGNSQTAQRGEAKQMIEDLSGFLPADLADPRRTVAGTVGQVGVKAAQMLYGGFTGRSREAVRGELARIGTLAPDERDRVVRALLDAQGARGGVSDAINQAATSPAALAAALLGQRRLPLQSEPAR